MSIGEKVSFSRKQKGYTQESLAMVTNLSLSTIKRIEREKVVPRLHTLKILSRVLDVDLSTLTPMKGKVEIEPSDLRLILLFSASLVFFPPLNIVFLLSLWVKKGHKKFFDILGKKVLSFQTVTFILLALSIGLIPFLTYNLTGHRMYGQLNIVFFVYVCFVFSNLVMIALTYRRETKSGLKMC